MRYKIFRNIDSIRQIEKAWNNIFNENNHLEVFQSPEWVTHWYLQYRSAQEMFCIAFYNDSGEIIAIVPLAIDHSTKLLHFAGRPLNDYNNIIVKKNNSSAKILSETLQIIGSVDGVEHFIVDCIDLNDKWLTSTDLTNLRDKIFINNDDISVFVKLPSSYQEYLKTINSKKLKKFIYYEKRLFKHDKVEFNRLSLDSDISEFIIWFKKNKIINWRRSGQYNQILNQLKEDSFYTFLQVVIKKLLKKKQVIIPYIKIGNQLIASGIYYVFHKKVMKYIQSWDYEYKAYNPGTVLDWLMIRKSIEDNHTIFDFGRGEEGYKYAFGGENKHLLRVTIKL